MRWNEGTTHMAVHVSKEGLVPRLPLKNRLVQKDSTDGMLWSGNLRCHKVCVKNSAV